jgi:hypothetical protein
MKNSDLKKKIDLLQMQLQAMKNNPALKEDYKEKVEELMKLRRILIQKGVVKERGNPRTHNGTI